jgi:transcription-repair coupling factor (superfamily II helicase)
MRVNMYRRIAGIATEPEVRALREELQDRLGPLPPALDRLFKITELRLHAHEKGIAEIETREGKLMMKRSGDWLMRNKRFPRLTGSTPTAQLEELIALVRAWPDGGG